MKLEIDVARWAQVLGPGVLAMAYFDTSNARDWDAWHQLVADDATHTANIDSSGLTVRSLKQTVFGGILETMPDVHTVISNIRLVSERAAIGEWHTEGTLGTGQRYINDGFIKFELNDEGKIGNVTVAEFSIDAIDGMRDAGFAVPSAPLAG